MDFEFRIGVLGGRFVVIYASKLVANLTRHAFDDDHMLIVVELDRGMETRHGKRKIE